MSMEQIEAGLAAMCKRYQQAAGQLALLEGQRNEKAEELIQAKSDVETWEKVQALFARASEYAREQLKSRVEETVTAALLAVFGEGLTFRINIYQVGGQPAAEWQVISQYGNLEVAACPEDARGGGITDVVSLALRLAMLELVRPRVKGPVILDEPGKMISAEYAENLAGFLKQYAASMGRQVIMVTHNAALADVADKSYLVTQKDGVSEAREIEKLDN